jgi:vacuolar-type H+-ATPase subunit E/Vma4
MGIEKLKGSLLSEASAEAENIVKTAEAHVNGMLKEERAKLKAMESDAKGEIEKLLEERRNERIAWARLEAKRITAEAKEDAIKNVLEDLFQELKKARKSPQYERFLKDAVADAVAELGKGSKVHVPKGEKRLLPKLPGAQVVEDLEGLGGAMVDSPDGKVRMDLTLETLFDSMRDEIRKQIYEELFGGK